MADVNDVLREFDLVEANLKRLEDLWQQIEKAIPDGIVFMGNSPEALAYEESVRAFRRIAEVMPSIDGRRLESSVMDLDDIAQARLDAEEVGEFECKVSMERRIYQQAGHLRDYRSRFQHQRRVFARSHLLPALSEVDGLLREIASAAPSDSNRPVGHVGWEILKKTIDQIDVLLGSSASRGSRWGDLRRHLGFGVWQDFQDIVRLDWPNVKKAIEDGMYGKDEPLPVAVADLNSLASSHTSGAVSTRLKWESLSAEEFERLLYTLVCRTKGYDNTNWLMKTCASDRGRDIETWRTSEDRLIGSRRYRVIVQCKHWLTKSITVSEVAKLKEQMGLWEPPAVDELIIATSGRFAQDAVQSVEKQNERRGTPRIIMWPESHLEQLLASRPDIVAEFRLR